MVLDHFFIVLPVYRIAEQNYYSTLDSYISDQLLLAGSSPEDESATKSSHEIYLRSSYGGSWEFNEIIGFIKLYFYGNQIRGEYWGVKKKRIAKTRTKEFEYKTHKLYMELSIKGESNEDILLTVKEYIAGCKKELKNRHIDTREFETLSTYIDWVRLYKENRFFN